MMLDESLMHPRQATSDLAAVVGFQTMPSRWFWQLNVLRCLNAITSADQRYESDAVVGETSVAYAHTLWDSGNECSCSLRIHWKLGRKW